MLSRRNQLAFRVQPPRETVSGRVMPTFSVSGAPGYNGYVDVLVRRDGAECDSLAGVTSVRLNGGHPQSEARFAEVVLTEPGAYLVGVRVAPAGEPVWAAEETIVPELSFGARPPPVGGVVGVPLAPFTVVGPIGDKRLIRVSPDKSTPGTLRGTLEVPLDGEAPSVAIFDNVIVADSGKYFFRCSAVDPAAAGVGASASSASRGGGGGKPLPPVPAGGGKAGKPPKAVRSIVSSTPTTVSAGIVFGTSPPAVAAAGRRLAPFTVLGTAGAQGVVEISCDSTSAGIYGDLQVRLDGDPRTPSAVFSNIEVATPGTVTLRAVLRCPGLQDVSCVAPFPTTVVATPSYWGLDSKREVLKNMQKVMTDTCISEYIGIGRDSTGARHTGFEVVDVILNENVELWSRYDSCKTQLRHKLGSAGAKTRISVKTAPWPWIKIRDQTFDPLLNEVYLFHGTKPRFVPVIQQAGFEERVAEFGMFGAGVYFAECSSKSDEYITEDEAGLCYMFLSRVVLGNSFVALSEMINLRRPPCTTAGCDDPACLHPRHDSVTGEIEANFPTAQLKRYREFIVYDRQMAYPEWLIVFKRVGDRGPDTSDESSSSSSSSSSNATTTGDDDGDEDDTSNNEDDQEDQQEDQEDEDEDEESSSAPDTDNDSEQESDDHSTQDTSEPEEDEEEKDEDEDEDQGKSITPVKNNNNNNNNNKKQKKVAFSPVSPTSTTSAPRTDDETSLLTDQD